VIISDDGLQHYAMGRSIEIVVIDGMRGLGNGLCLPAGPLREPPSRLKKADFLVVNAGTFPNAYTMQLMPSPFRQLTSEKVVTAEALPGNIAALAGIGNPDRFFTLLQQLGLHFTPYAFPDHYHFTEQDVLCPEKTVVMTEKDAVKCRLFATDAMYYLPVEAKINEEFWDALYAHPQLRGLFSHD
jgi:tetraacyldisaccharide 4'-kinase